MDKKRLLTRAMALAGTLLVWLPVAAPLLFGLLRLARGAPFLYDYLMPAELFPVVLAGGGLLLCAALWARSRRWPVAAALGAAAAFLAAGVVVADVSGLASGEIEPSGPWFALVVALFVACDASVAALGVSGALLVRDLFRAGRDAAPGEGPSGTSGTGL